MCNKANYDVKRGLLSQRCVDAGDAKNIATLYTQFSCKPTNCMQMTFVKNKNKTLFNNIVIYHDVRIFFTSKIIKKKKMNSIKRCTQRVLIYRYLYETLNRLWRLTCEKCNMICAISHVKKKMRSKVKVHKIWANKELLKMHTARKLIASFLVEKNKMYSSLW